LCPEILATKPSSSAETATTSGLKSSLPASELNTSQGLAGTLIVQLVLESNREACLWGSNIADIMKKYHKIEEEILHQKALQAKDIYDGLLAKVQAIKEKNLPPEKLTVAELNTMIKWHKCPEDAAMPSKKVDKLARYHKIKGHGDPLMPQPIQMAIPPLPPLAGSKLINKIKSNFNALLCSI
jgi:hypothetical protein